MGGIYKSKTQGQELSAAPELFPGTFSCAHVYLSGGHHAWHSIYFLLERHLLLFLPALTGGFVILTLQPGKSSKDLVTA